MIFTLSLIFKLFWDNKECLESDELSELNVLTALVSFWNKCNINCIPQKEVWPD